MSWLMHMQQNLGIHNSGPRGHVGCKDSVAYIGYVCTAVSVHIGPIPFHRQKTHQMTEQLSSKHHRHSNIHETIVSQADNKIGLFMARFRLMIEKNMHVVMTSLYTF
jgi:hypothetical protein